MSPYEPDGSAEEYADGPFATDDFDTPPDLDTEEVTFKERLTTLRKHLPRRYRDDMDLCIMIADTIQKKATSPTAHTRTDDPDTSFGNVDRKSLSDLQQLVLEFWEIWKGDDPMDEETAIARFFFTHGDICDRSTVRKRRGDLTKFGYLVRVDKEGVSRRGRKAGRYLLTSDVKRWKKQEKKRIKREKRKLDEQGEVA